MVMQIFNNPTDSIVLSIDGPFYKENIIQEFNLPIGHEGKQLYTLTLQNNYEDPIKINSMEWFQIYLDSSLVHAKRFKTSINRETFLELNKPANRKNKYYNIYNIIKNEKRKFWFNGFPLAEKDTVTFYKTIERNNRKMKLVISGTIKNGKFEYIY